MAQPEKLPPRSLGLRAGDWIVVRSPEEILATLDSDARLDGQPFQPEMLAFCGRRLRVSMVAHKTCDNIAKTGGRRLLDTVHLDGSRCDGSAHGGCQADCVFFWKESWLRRAEPGAESASSPVSPIIVPELLQLHTRARGSEHDDDPAWVCQVTTVLDASTLLHWWDLRQYVRDITSGNHSAWYMVRLQTGAMYRRFVNFGPGFRAKIAFYNWFQRLTGGKPYPIVSPKIASGQPTPTAILDLQPGELVEIRSPAEIDATITEDGFNRGMRYDMEMRKYSGERHRVQLRVNRLINEKTGKMLLMKNPCIQLEDVYCRAQCTDRRLGCPRASNTYWREIWLRRVEGE